MQSKNVILLFIFINKLLIGQIDSLKLSPNDKKEYPNILSIKELHITNKKGNTEIYDFYKHELKAFLFFNTKTEPTAQLLYNGCKFMFSKNVISIFPIFVTELQLNAKPSLDFPSIIPVQKIILPFKSDFKDFKLNENDFPLVIFYNEKNELCGSAKSSDQLAEINCSGEDETSKLLKLKILTEEKDKINKPYAFKPIVILGADLNDTISNTTTNQYGDFEVKLTNLNQDYIIKVDEKIQNINFVVLSTQSGKEVGKFKSTGSGFEYRILKLDLVMLPDIFIDEDIVLKIKNFEKKQTKNLSITENLFFDSDGTSLNKNSKELLDKMEVVLLKHPQFNLLVTSHTDSQGDDLSNLNLSLKRSEVVINYLVSKGIQKSRLKAIGKGESLIRNRCHNEIDCSDMEHQYNRRTDFLFSKK